MSRALEGYKLGLAAVSRASRALEDYELRSAAVSRVLEDYKFGSMGAAMNALSVVEKEKETFMTHRDTEEHENNT